jgi:hypothetical protein
MLKPILTAILILGLGGAAARAQDAEKLAASVPAEISEVATAGTWSDASKTGIFRAIIVTTPSGGATQAQLAVQLVALSADGTQATVAKTIFVKKISEKKLPNAFLAVEEDSTENEITWRLTSYDAASDTDSSVLVTVNAKGEVQVKDAPKDEDFGADAAAEKKKEAN